MKKFKLLTSLSTLGVLTAAVPMVVTSCNKEEKEVPSDFSIKVTPKIDPVQIPIKVPNATELATISLFNNGDPYTENQTIDNFEIKVTGNLSLEQKDFTITRTSETSNEYILATTGDYTIETPTVPNGKISVSWKLPGSPETTIKAQTLINVIYQDEAYFVKAIPPTKDVIIPVDTPAETELGTFELYKDGEPYTDVQTDDKFKVTVQNFNEDDIKITHKENNKYVVKTNSTYKVDSGKLCTLTVWWQDPDDVLIQANQILKFRTEGEYSATTLSLDARIPETPTGAEVMLGTITLFVDNGKPFVETQTPDKFKITLTTTCGLKQDEINIRQNPKKLNSYIISTTNYSNLQKDQEGTISVEWTDPEGNKITPTGQEIKFTTQSSYTATLVKQPEPIVIPVDTPAVITLGEISLFKDGKPYTDPQQTTNFGFVVAPDGSGLIGNDIQITLKEGNTYYIKTTSTYSAVKGKSGYISVVWTDPNGHNVRPDESIIRFKTQD